MAIHKLRKRIARGQQLNLVKFRSDSSKLTRISDCDGFGYLPTPGSLTGVIGLMNVMNMTEEFLSCCDRLKEENRSNYSVKDY